MTNTIIDGNKAALAAFLLLALSACSTVQVGRNFDIGMFEVRAKAGETSQSQVRGWLGEPRSTGISLDKDGERFEEWIYYHGTGRMPKMEDAKLKLLQIRFDRNGVLRSYNWSGDN